MNDNAKKWVAALRSGNYRQAKHVLTQITPTGDLSHCCLGVACELALEAGVPLEVTTDHGERTYDGATSSLPRSVQTWLGLRDALGSSASLSWKNDQGATFLQIADIIVSEPEGLFSDIIEFEPEGLFCG